MPTEKFLTSFEENEIIEAIRKAEKQTSGEIRVHIEGSSQKDPFERALEVFEKLDMYQTKNRNAVLFYIAVDDRSFVIFGDKGINEVVAGNFWETTKNIVVQHFKKGNFKTGIIEGVLMAGQQLKVHFPNQIDDIDELPNEISQGNI